MQKYSVVTSRPSEDGKKTSSVATCPLCGREAVTEGEVIRCPEHGSKPFETPAG